MKRTNKLLLTMGTAAAIVAPVASVVACGAKTQSEVDNVKTQLNDLYKQLGKLTETRDTNHDNNEELGKLRTKITELTHELESLGVKMKRSVLNIKDVKADLTITDPDLANLEVIRISNTLSKLSAAIQDATTNAEMKVYYPQYIRTNNELKKAKDHHELLLNPPAPTNPAKEYNVSDSIIKGFTDYFEPLFEGGAKISTYADFTANKNNEIAEVGQILGTDTADSSHVNWYSLDDDKPFGEGNLGNGFGDQKFDLNNGLTPHVDVKYDIKNGVDDKSISDFFKTNIYPASIKALAGAFKGNAFTKTINDGHLDPSLKLFPYVYTDKNNPGYIHFALFAYKTEAPVMTIPQGEVKHPENLTSWAKYQAAYNQGGDKGESIRRGIKILGDAVGRDLSKQENFYTTDDDFKSIMDNLYYAPKRVEMQYLNSHISDADRVSLYEQLYDGGAYNVMASGRVYGVDPAKLYSGKDGAYEPTIKNKGTFVDDTLRVNAKATPGYQSQTLADEKAAEDKYHAAEQFHTSTGFLDQKTPGREMPTLAQNSLDFSAAMFYDLGGQIPFEHDSSGKITGIKAVNLDNRAEVQRMADLHEAMYAMTQADSENAIYYAGLTSWPRGGNRRINPFLRGLDINYFTVRNRDNKNDLDIVFKASRAGEALPTYKMVIPEGAMNWDQINKAVETDPVFKVKSNRQLSKEDFEFMMMKVMAKWVESGSAVGDHILPSVSNLLTEGLKTTLSLEKIDKYYEMLKTDNSVDLNRLSDLVTNPDIDFMDVFMSEAWDSQSRKVLYTKYGENLLNVIAKISKQQILSNPSVVPQDVIDSLTNEFEGL